MDQFKEPEIYDKLRSLEIADLDPSEFGEGQLFGQLFQGIAMSGITANDLEKSLNEEKRFLVLRSVDAAVVVAAESRPHNSDKAPAAQTLSGVRSLSSLLLPATRPNDMAASPAKAYHEGHCSRRKYYSETEKNVSSPSSLATRSIRYDNEGGFIYYVRSIFIEIPRIVPETLTFRRGLWTRAVTLQTAGEDYLVSLTRQPAKRGRPRRSSMLLTR